MKRSGIIAGLGIVLAVALLVAWRAGWPPFHPPLRIGVVLPLSGPDAAFGLGMRNSMRLAVDEANARGGIQGRRVELLALDSGSRPDQAEAEGARLAADRSVVVTLGDFTPSSSLATQVVFAEAGLANVLTAVPTRDNAQFRNPREFRLIPLGTQLMTHAANHAWETLGARRFSFVHDASFFGRMMVFHLRDGLAPHGQFTGELMFRAEDDTEETVKRILAESPDYVLFGGTADRAGLLVKRLRAAGFRGTFHAGTQYPSQEFIDGAGESAEGAVCMFHGVPAEGFPEGRAFLQRYSEHGFGEGPSIEGIHAYAGTQVVLQALDKSFLSRPSVAGALSHEEFATALGPVRFNYLSSSCQTAAIYKVSGGHWQPVLVTDTAGKLQPYQAR